jgi:hypothetical protein
LIALDLHVDTSTLRVAEFTVGSAADWLDVSDHRPMILDLAAGSE